MKNSPMSFSPRINKFIVICKVSLAWIAVNYRQTSIYRDEKNFQYQEILCYGWVILRHLRGIIRSG